MADKRQTATDTRQWDSLAPAQARANISDTRSREHAAYRDLQGHDKIAPHIHIDEYA
jgi:hypothetical protein